MDDLTDARLLRRCFGLAKLAKNRGNGAFGAILAEGKVVLFEGENTVTEAHGDLTCHAEMNVLREASHHYDKHEFARFTLYCSTEPCPMCTGAAYYCGVGRIVYGMPNHELVERSGKGLAMPCRDLLGQAPERVVEVTGPLLVDEAAPIHG